MSGHNKFSKIKHLKAKNDAEKSKHFSKLVRLITVEAKKAKGDTKSPGLQAAIEKARKENMPNDTVLRAVKKALSDNGAAMENIVYETYGPGGTAIIISVLTDNRNKSAQEIKHILSAHGTDLSSPGGASWAFNKTHEGWEPKTTIPLEDADIEALERLANDLEENEDVQDVFTNAE
jgi:YebC/PmpR family DNA-binding regulatory protein